MSTQQTYIGTPKSPVQRISTANANRDGTGTIAVLHTAGANGARIDDISIKATGTTTAGMIRFYKSIDAGVTWKLVRERLVSAVTPSGVAASFEDVITDWAYIMQASDKLGVSTQNGETFDVSVNRGGDF